MFLFRHVDNSNGHSYQIPVVKSKEGRNWKMSSMSTTATAFVGGIVVGLAVARLTQRSLPSQLKQKNEKSHWKKKSERKKARKALREAAAKQATPSAESVTKKPVSEVEFDRKEMRTIQGSSQKVLRQACHYSASGTCIVACFAACT